MRSWAMMNQNKFGVDDLIFNIAKLELAFFLKKKCFPKLNLIHLIKHWKVMIYTSSVTI